MKENEKFPKPIITPTTKAAEGHDEDISREEIINQGLYPPKIIQSLKNIPIRFLNGDQK